MKETDLPRKKKQSQNHSMAEVERGLWSSSDPTSSLQQIAQVHVQTVFEHVQGWRLYDIPGQSGPVPGHPHSEKVFLDVQREPPEFQHVPIASGPVTGHH